MAIAYNTLAGDRLELELAPEQEAAFFSLNGQARRDRWLAEHGLLPGDKAKAKPAAATEQPPAAAPALAQQLTDLAQQLSGLASQLANLEERFSLQQLTDVGQVQADLAAWARAAERIGTAHLELAALQEQTTRHVDGVATAADERLAALDAGQAEQQATLAASMAEARQRLQALELEQERRLQQAEALAATLIGPQGATGDEGMPGASTTISLERPDAVDQTSWARHWFGRSELIAGDAAFVVEPNAVVPFRFDGAAWREGPRIEPKQELINATVSAVDTGNKIYGPGGGGGAGGGSATGSDPLMVRTAAGSSGSSTQIADSSRWSVPLKVKGLPSPTSAKVALQITAVDGAQAGKSLFILCGLLYEPGGVSSIRSRYTEFSLLGDLKDAVEVDLTMQIQGAAAPGGLSVSVPAGVNAAAIYLTITRNAVGATRFILAGGVEWLLSQDTSPDASHPSLLPAWQL